MELDKFIKIDDFVDKSMNGTVFSAEWFLQLKDVKDFIVCYQNNEIVSIMPLFRNKQKRRVLNQSTMYIPYGGPVILKIPKEQRNKIRFLRELCEEYIKVLKENFEEISFSSDPFITDIMPFIRAGFMPEVRYTYKLDITKPEELLNNYGHDRRKEIRNAIKNNVEFIIDKDLELTEIEKFVSWEQKYGFPSSCDEVKEILKNAILNDNGMCFVARKDGHILGSVGMLWRKETAYIMYSYFDKNFDLGAISFLYHNIFKFLNMNKNIKIIDFEGSVYESVEKWNISFNAYQDRFYNLHFNKFGNDEIARTMYAYFEK